MVPLLYKKIIREKNTGYSYENSHLNDTHTGSINFI